VVGQVDAAEMQSINSLQTREQELTYRVGQLFREALSVAMQAGEAHHGLQRVMQGLRQRMSIPDDSLFRISYDGNIHLVAPPAPEGGATPEAEAPIVKTKEDASEEE